MDLALDENTIANAIRKRLKPLVGTEPGGFSALVGFPDVTVVEFTDAWGIAIAVAIAGTVYPLAKRIARDAGINDVHNVADFFAEAVKKIRSARFAPRDWELERLKLIKE